MNKDKKEMIEGIKIEFRKDVHEYFETEWNDGIDAELLILSLLETINDICKEYNLDINQKLNRYINMGSIDNYNTEEEKKVKEMYKTF